MDFVFYQIGQRCDFLRSFGNIQTKIFKNHKWKYYKLLFSNIFRNHAPNTHTHTFFRDPKYFLVHVQVRTRILIFFQKCYFLSDMCRRLSWHEKWNLHYVKQSYRQVCLHWIQHAFLQFFRHIRQVFLQLKFLLLYQLLAKCLSINKSVWDAKDMLTAF